MNSPVVAEAQRDPARPALFLGDTAFAHAHEVQPAQLPGWSYVHRVIGGDVIIAGHDQPSPAAPLAEKTKTPQWDRIGTAKAAADFLRQYVGTRFLFPDITPHAVLGSMAKVDLLRSPGIEFLPTPTIAIPADLNVRKVSVIEFNSGGTQSSGFYDLANNRFPFIDTAFGTHTYSRAIPVEKYYGQHPEYFALLRTAGKGPKAQSRVKDDQYCISNPEVQELIYQDLITQLDRGYQVVDLGQPDGFRPCQCDECAKLYGTGDDWSEKIWIFHRGLAERVLAARPDKKVMILSYILTAKPPKTFTKFPANTRIMWTGTNDTDIAAWQGVEVPGGFTGYVYNWCPNLGTSYTPMRTPLYVETQVKRLVQNRVQGLKRDSSGILYGLEGPVYYTMGRMFDDPEHLRASDLVAEFCEGAFGARASKPMLRFYDQLYHGIELYSDFLGTRSPAWHYVDIYEKKHKYLSDPYQLLGFLYTPKLLASLESELAQAEQAANTDKIKARLALIRREFNYVKALARVIHLTQAYETQPDLASRDRVLDAIDARNAEIGAYYDARGRAVATAGWPFPIFPTLGHMFEHLKLAHNGYQEPFEETSVNWETKAMRAAPLPGALRLVVHYGTGGAPTLDSSDWTKAAGLPLGAQSTLRALHDGEALYLRLETEIAPQSPTTSAPGEPDLRQAESLDVYLAPLPGTEKYYRFMAGPSPEARWDAAAGLIADAMDPRHGKDDPDWNGDWTCHSRVDPATHRWLALLRIPYKTLGVPAPTAGAFWRGNFGRVHLTAPGQADRAVWASQPGRPNMDDRSAFGEIVFE